MFPQNNECDASLASADRRLTPSDDTANTTNNVAATCHSEAVAHDGTAGVCGKDKVVEDIDAVCTGESATEGDHNIEVSSQPPLQDDNQRSLQPAAGDDDCVLGEDSQHAYNEPAEEGLEVRIIARGYVYVVVDKKHSKSIIMNELF